MISFEILFSDFDFFGQVQYLEPKGDGFGDLDLKKGVDHDLKLEKGEVWNKI